MIFQKHIREAVFGDEKKQCGGRADQGVGANAGTLLADLPFKPDDSREQERHTEFADLLQSLSVCVKE